MSPFAVFVEIWTRFAPILHVNGLFLGFCWPFFSKIEIAFPNLEKSDSNRPRWLEYASTPHQTSKKANCLWFASSLSRIDGLMRPAKPSGSPAGRHRHGQFGGSGGQKIEKFFFSQMTWEWPQMVGNPSKSSYLHVFGHISQLSLLTPGSGPNTGLDLPHGMVHGEAWSLVLPVCRPHCRSALKWRKTMKKVQNMVIRQVLEPFWTILE